MRVVRKRARLSLLVVAAVLLTAAMTVGHAGAQGSPSPPFTQCPAIDQDKSCQYLIVISSSGTSVLNDSSQGAYEGTEDTLIGIQNNTSQPIAKLPLSAPANGGEGLFHFEADGLCDPGSAPVPAGCQPAPGAPAGTKCDGSAGLNCSFPPPAGEPANYTDALSTNTEVTMPWPNGDKQSGYEGPTSWFSGISADETAGTVNFSPPIPAGGSTYVSLESPPGTNSITVGTPSTPNGTPPSSGATPPKTLPPAFGKNGVIQIPSSKKCLSKRSFKIHIVRHRGLTYLTASVFVGGKSVGVIRGARLSAGVNLKGLPQGTFKVKIVVVTSDGRVISGTRTYHTCAHHRLPGHPHFL